MKIRLLVLKNIHISSLLYYDHILEIKNKKIIQIQDNYYKIRKYKNKYVCNNYNHFNIYENINITKEQYKMLVESKDIIVIKMIIDIIKHENNIS